MTGYQFDRITFEGIMKLDQVLMVHVATGIVERFIGRVLVCSRT